MYASVAAFAVFGSSVTVLKSVIGMGLWAHQLFVVYLIPLGVIFAMRRID